MPEVARRLEHMAAHVLLVDLGLASPTGFHAQALKAAVEEPGHPIADRMALDADEFTDFRVRPSAPHVPQRDRLRPQVRNRVMTPGVIERVELLLCEVHLPSDTLCRRKIRWNGI